MKDLYHIALFTDNNVYVADCTVCHLHRCLLRAGYLRYGSVVAGNSFTTPESGEEFLNINPFQMSLHLTLICSG